LTLSAFDAIDKAIIVPGRVPVFLFRASCK